MKVLVAANNYQSGQKDGVIGWFLLADSAVINTGKPFYLPEGYGVVTVSLGVALKISRLGKGILKKFANRYYSEFAPVLHFSLPDYERQLIEMGLPGDAARSFDKSLIVGEGKDKENFKEPELWKNGEKIFSYSFSDLSLSPDEIIAEVSLLNTLKMGDLIVAGVSPAIKIEEGDFLEVKSGEERVFHVRVK